MNVVILKADIRGISNKSILILLFKYPSDLNSETSQLYFAALYLVKSIFFLYGKTENYVPKNSQQL